MGDARTTPPDVTAGAASTNGVAFDQVQDQLLRYAKDLRAALARSREATDALARTHLETVAALAAAVDVRDEVTGGHVYRVANYGVRLAEHMAPELRNDPQLVYGFLLHDIGKLAVPDGILNKQGALDEAEYDVLKTHVSHGVRFIKRVSFLRPALNIISTHHESWDGTGYPQRLRGAEIPLGARMFAVCDALDAMLHDRPYRRALSAEDTLAELRRCAGTQFDPDVVEAAGQIMDELIAIPDHPPIPGLALERPSDQRLASAVAADPVVEALDHAVVVLGADGRILEANRAFKDLFGLGTVPVGLSLQDVIRRSTRSLAAPARARDEMHRLELDLFKGRREGRLALQLDRAEGEDAPAAPDVEILRWHSNRIDGRGDEVSGRVVVFERNSSRGPVTPPTQVTRELDELARLIEVDAEQPGAPERLERVRAGIERVRRWIETLDEQGRV